jgi:hypothetical protein
LFTTGHKVCGKVPVRLAVFPAVDPDITVVAPVHATGVGLVMHREAVPDQRQNNQEEKPSKGLVSWLKNLF